MLAHGLLVDAPILPLGLHEELPPLDGFLDVAGLPGDNDEVFGHGPDVHDVNDAGLEGVDEVDDPPDPLDNQGAGEIWDVLAVQEAVPVVGPLAVVPVEAVPVPGAAMIANDNEVPEEVAGENEPDGVPMHPQVAQDEQDAENPAPPEPAAPVEGNNPGSTNLNTVVSLDVEGQAALTSLCTRFAAMDDPSGWSGVLVEAVNRLDDLEASLNQCRGYINKPHCQCP
ncbi:unnamed protein product [Peniophora sp. CBMAI 1063]|nr:unnamed protein product [Peniophora sp. CBMAI 1063]